MGSGWKPLGVETRDPALVDLGDGLAVPAEFAASFVNGRRTVVVHVRVEAAGRGQPVAEVARVEVARSPALSPSDLTGVPWGALFDEAVAAGAAFGLARDSAGGAFVAFADPEAVERAARRLRRRRGRHLTAEHLALVAEVAAANPKRPEAAVAEAWGVGRTTAAYWLRRAREQEG